MSISSESSFDGYNSYEEELDLSSRERKKRTRNSSSGFNQKIRQEGLNGARSKTTLPPKRKSDRAPVKKRPRSDYNQETKNTADSNIPGAWERHTRGIASKILAKHGFTGRLGKNADGIATPIARPSRPRQLGVGADQFDRLLNSRLNRPAASSSDDEIAEASNDEVDQVDSDDEIELVSHVHSKESTEGDAVQDENALIRQQEEHLESKKANALFSSPQLLENIQMLHSNAKAQLMRSHRQEEAEETILCNTLAELSRMQRNHLDAQQKVSVLLAARSVISSMVSTLKDTPDDTKGLLAVVRNAASLVQRSSIHSIHSIRRSVIKATVAAVSSHVQSKLSTILSDATRLVKGGRSSAASLAKLLETARVFIPHEDYVKLCAISVLSPLTVALSDVQWNAVQGVGTADVVSALNNVLPRAIVNVFAEESLSPKLLLAAKIAQDYDVNYTENVIPMRLWIHPWLPICGRAALVDTLHQVRLQLTAALVRWKVTDDLELTSRLASDVSAWSTVLSRRKVQIALSSHVVPKLCDAVAKLSVFESSEWDLVGAIVKIWGAVIARRVLGDSLSDALLRGPGSALRNAVFGDHDWTIGRDMYKAVLQWLPDRMKSYLRRTLAAMLFVIHAARVTEGDPVTRSILAQAPLSPLLKNTYWDPGSSSATTKSSRSALQGNEI